MSTSQQVWIIPSSVSQLGVGGYLSRPPGLLIIPSSAYQFVVEFYQSRLFETVDNNNLMALGLASVISVASL